MINFLKLISEDIDKFRFNRYIYFIVLLYPVLLLINSYYWMILKDNREYLNFILKENYPVETLTLITIFGSVFLGIKLIISMKRRGVELYKIVFVALMTAGLFFVGMEEMSWGQWLFKFKSPDYFRYSNLQRETNIHNLKGLHVIFEYVRVFIGIGGFLTIFLNNKKALKYISAPFVLLLAFIVITIFSGLDVYNFYLTDQRVLQLKGSFWWFIKFNMEIIELMIAVSAFVFLISNYRRLNS